MDTPAVVDINYAIDNYLISSQEDVNDEEWVKVQMINCLRELHAFYIQGVGRKEDILIVDSTVNTAQLPTDYINWITFGEITDNKKIQAIAYNPHIPLVNTMECGLKSYEFLDAEPRGIISFNIDKRERIVQFDGGVPNGSRVYIKYITSGIMLDRNTMIPAHWITTLNSYVDWRFARNRSKNTRNKGDVVLAQQYGREYTQYVQRLQRDENALRTQSFYKMMYNR